MKHAYCGCNSYREHDKGPEEFCSVLLRLVDTQLPFQVSILGSHSNDIPGVFIIKGICRTYRLCFHRMLFEDNSTAGLKTAS